MKNKKALFLLTAGIIFVSLGIFLQNRRQIIKVQNLNPPPLVLSQDVAKVVRIIDGDTIDVQINNKMETVRLIGIDSPEIVDPRIPVQCFGSEASNYAKEILNNQTVKLEVDPTQGERDKYGRLLRFVFLPDGTNFNKLMISQGYAHEYTYKSNPYKYQSEFKNSEKEAREKGLGLWNKCDKI